jgi:hypothetical protein
MPAASRRASVKETDPKLEQPHFTGFSALPPLFCHTVADLFPF